MGSVDGYRNCGCGICTTEPHWNSVWHSQKWEKFIQSNTLGHICTFRHNGTCIDYIKYYEENYQRQKEKPSIHTHTRKASTLSVFVCITHNGNLLFYFGQQFTGKKHFFYQYSHTQKCGIIILPICHNKSAQLPVTHTEAIRMCKIYTPWCVIHMLMK